MGYGIGLGYALGYGLGHELKYGLRGIKGRRVKSRETS